MAWTKRGIVLLAPLLNLWRICDALCKTQMETCTATYDTAALGRGPDIVCPAFANFQKCFWPALATCDAAEKTQYTATYAGMQANVKSVAPACLIQTTMPPAIKEIEDSSSSGSLNSGDSGSGDSDDSSSLNAWQMMLFGTLLAICCCCIAAAGAFFARSRRHGYGRYDRDYYDDEMDDYGRGMGGPNMGGPMYPQGPPPQVGYGPPTQNMYPAQGGGYDYGGYNAATMPTTYNMQPGSGGFGGYNNSGYGGGFGPGYGGGY